MTGLGRIGIAAVVLLAFASASGCAQPSGSPLPADLVRAAALAWGGEQRLVTRDAAENDQFGYAVSLSADGTRALVGAYGEGAYRGGAYVFVGDGSTWTEEQKLVASDRAEGDSLGWSVSLSGDGARALVGAYGESVYRGAAYVFVRNGSTWTQDQKLVASDRAELDQFGFSVSLEADRAVIGAFGSGTARGAAYVFVRDGSIWTEEQKLVASDAAPDDRLGFAVAVNADQALIGAYGRDMGRGAVYSFSRSGSVWIEGQKLVPDDGLADDHFGNAVSLDADRALIGAYWNGDLRGAAYVFARGGGSWAEEQKLVPSEGAPGDRFGNGISLRGDRALIGAFGYDSNRGKAYTFVRSENSWTEEQELVARDGATLDAFAWSVSLANDVVLTGAFYADQLRGKAYAFSLGLRNGESCAADSVCASRHCVDERCCDTECTGACGACSIAEGAKTDGTCTVFPVGFQGSPDCGTLTCNGQSVECVLCESDTDCSEMRYCTGDGTCQPRVVKGAACDDRAGTNRLQCLLSGCRSCRSGFCVDGVCCDSACDGLCQACTAELTGSGVDGRCGAVRAGTDPDEECRDDGVATCQANGLCDGLGGCQRYSSHPACSPESCIRGDVCTSGHCEDGICCDRACAPSERCRAALKISGEDGVCGPARAAALGTPCKFDVQCTSGQCAAGVCASGSGPGGDGDNAGCGCRMDPAPGSWVGVAVGLLFLPAWGRHRRRAQRRNHSKAVGASSGGL